MLKMLYELLTHVSTVRASKFKSVCYVDDHKHRNSAVFVAVFVKSANLTTCKCILTRELYNVDCLESDSKTLQFIYGPATLGISFTFSYIFFQIKHLGKTLVL